MKKVLLLSAAMVAISPPAYAYLDPGTGSMIIQAVIGAVIGAGVALKFYWHRAKEFFARKFGPK